jgi:hypothetical protein
MVELTLTRPGPEKGQLKLVFGRRLAKRAFVPTMLRSGLQREKGRKARSSEDDVKVMEERLLLLKQQMLVEKQRRQEIMQRTGPSGSIWKTGAAGPLRDKKAVESMVRLEGLRRQSSVAVDSEDSRASTARKESPPCNDQECYPHPQTPKAPNYSQHADIFQVGSYDDTASIMPLQMNRPASAMCTSAEIQTESGRVKKWEINVHPSKRPQSAPRGQTYFEKVLETRRRLLTVNDC